MHSLLAPPAQGQLLRPKDLPHVSGGAAEPSGVQPQSCSLWGPAELHSCSCTIPPSVRPPVCPPIAPLSASFYSSTTLTLIIHRFVYLFRRERPRASSLNLLRRWGLNSGPHASECRLYLIHHLPGPHPSIFLPLRTLVLLQKGPEVTRVPLRAPQKHWAPVSAIQVSRLSAAQLQAHSWQHSAAWGLGVQPEWGFTRVKGHPAVDTTF